LARASSSGSSPLIGHEIAKGGEIDVLILGASDGWTGVDPAIIAEELSKTLGRPARVLNFGTNWAGEERFAQIVNDLRNQVRARVVLGFENDALQNIPHELSKFWWRSPVTTEGLDWRQRLQLHTMQVIGWPRHIWVRIFSGDRRMTPSYATYTKDLIDAAGFNAEARGWRSHREPNEANRRPMPTSVPMLPALDPATFEFPGTENANFKWQRYGYSPLQTHFFRQADALVKAQGGVYATIALPTHFTDAPLDRVIVRPMADGQPRTWPVLGIAQTALFQGASFEEMKNFYSNESHLNKPGAALFTRAIMPAIKRLHEQATAR
jgi:hypothetical protein